MRARLTLILIAMLALAACAKLLGIKHPDQKPFPHRAHVLRGHACQSCHEGMTSAEGRSRRPSQDVCVRCHTKPHDTNDCANCHGIPELRWYERHDDAKVKFSHKKHAGRAFDNCVRCHQDASRDSTQRPSAASCISCHSDVRIQQCDRCHVAAPTHRRPPNSHFVHGDDFLREHATRSTASRETCETCHSNSFCASCHGKTVAALPEKLRFDEPTLLGVHRAGFLSRHGMEARLQAGLCSSCHTQDSCESCHSRNKVSANSSDARSPHGPGWLGPRGSNNDHGRAAHRDPISCASCHSGPGEALCVGCHKVGGIGGSPHRAGFSSRLRPTVDQPCRQCHGVGR